MKFPFFFLYHYGGSVFRKMTCSKVENHFALPLLEKGQRLVIMIPHKACSERQKGKWPHLKSQILELEQILRVFWSCPSPLAG